MKEEAHRCGLKHHIEPKSVKTAIENQLYHLKKDIALLSSSVVEAIKHSTSNFLTLQNNYVEQTQNRAAQNSFRIKMINVLSCINLIKVTLSIIMLSLMALFQIPLNLLKLQ